MLPPILRCCGDAAGAVEFDGGVITAKDWPNSGRGAGHEVMRRRRAVILRGGCGLSRHQRRRPEHDE